MEEVQLSLNELHSKLLKGLPIKSVAEGQENESKPELWTKLVLNFDNEVDDNFLLEAYQIYGSIRNDCQSKLETQNMSDSERSEILLLFAIKLIRLFVQLNSTGPILKFKCDGSTSISLSTKVIFEELELKNELQLDGYEISELTILPQLLIVCQEFLRIDSGKPEFWIGKLQAWWFIRACYLHQRILDGRSITLAGHIGTAAAAIHKPLSNFKDDLDLKTLLLCEQSDIHLYYYDIVSARNCLAEAAKVCGAQFFTTGVLGKKTKFQQKDLAQLVVQANTDKRSENRENLVYYEEFKECRVIVDVRLDDDTRLEKMKIKESSDEKTYNLTTTQQIMLLAELNFMKKSQPKDVLLKEEILAYCNSLLEDPKLWNVFIVALLHRSIFETDNFRTVERSMMQFENIQKATRLLMPSFNSRYQFYHASCMPLTWEVDLAFGDVLLSLGHVKSALDIFISLNMWENVIACYNLLELKHKAEEVIRQQIERNGETPKLLVYLGDATNDIQFYESAWELSDHKSFLSRQRLGVYWFKKQEFEKSIPYFQTAVELNPLEYPVWVRLAYAALHTENWKICVKAYVHANNLDDESFENWNNLAKATLKLGNKDQALRALKQATKCNYEEWKVWENLMIVALQCCDLEWTIMAFNRLIDLKGSYSDDTVLKLLVELVCDDNWDKRGDSSVRCKDALQKLLGRISSKISTSAIVWQSYSTFLLKAVQSNPEDQKSEEKWYNIVQYQQKAVRCRIHDKNWDKIPELTQQTVEATLLLCTRTKDFLNALPNSPLGKESKIQVEYLYRQVTNSIDRKLKEIPDSSMYSDFASELQKASI